MSKTKKYLWRSLVIIGALCILNLPFTVRGQEGSSVEELNELSAIVYMQVSWSREDVNLIKTGSMSALVFGNLTLLYNRYGILGFSPGSEGMQAEVNYQNECRNQDTGELCYKEVGSGSVQVAKYPSMTRGCFEFIAFTGLGGILHAQQLSGQPDIDSLTKAMTSQENMDHYLTEAMTSQENMDHYFFTVFTPIQTVRTDKDGNSTALIESIDFTLTVEALRGGAISNSVSWTAKPFYLLHMGYTNFMGILEHRPPKAKEGDYKNTVSWTFGEVKIPCNIIEDRIKETKINKELYSSETIKDYYKNKCGEERRKEYNNGIEKIAEHVWAEECQTAAEAEQFINNLTEDDIKWMESNPPQTPPGEGPPPEAAHKAELDALFNPEDPCDIKEMTLFGNLEGNKVIMTKFEKNKDNVWKGTKRDGYLKVEFEYLQKYGPEVGKALFDCMVKHEETHKEQYAHHCFPKTIDEVSKYEMEAYATEIKCLEDYSTEFNCD